MVVDKSAEKTFNVCSYFFCFFHICVVWNIYTTIMDGRTHALYHHCYKVLADVVQFAACGSDYDFADRLYSRGSKEGFKDG